MADIIIYIERNEKVVIKQICGFYITTGMNLMAKIAGMQ